MATDKTLAAAWTSILAAWPFILTQPTEIQAAGLQNFCDAMREFDDGVAAAAVADVRTNSTAQYPPPVGEYRKRAFELIDQAERAAGRGLPTAGEAWAMLAKALLSDGASGYVWRADVLPVVREAATQFGLRRFVARMEDAAGTDFAQFRGIYESLVNRAQIERRMVGPARDVVAKLAASLSADAPRLKAPPDIAAIEETTK